VVLMISNNRDAGALRRASEAGIAWAHMSGRTHPDPVALDEAITVQCSAARADVVLLAGYMKLLGPRMLMTYNGRIVNTHPALLPAFGGKGMYGDRVHAAVLAARVATSGASVHLVTAGYDEGPVLAQAEVPVLQTDDIASLGDRVREAEKAVLVRVLAGWSTTGKSPHF
jgi:phosphoribosylglycinamide formyltransferase-1